MNRHHKHDVARNAIVTRLRRLGFDVADAARNSKYDLLVTGDIRVALRVAFPGKYAHTVTVNGQRYVYNYTSWNFNFHRHGRWEDRYCDVFVCIVKQRRAADEIFVIPAAAISGPTFSLHDSDKPYRGRYAEYRNRWGVFTQRSRLTEARSAVA